MLVSSQQCSRHSSCAQVQDVGLIFLSAMASSVAVECQHAGASPEATLGTALVTLTASTFLVGSAVTLVGARASTLRTQSLLAHVQGSLAYPGSCAPLNRACTLVMFCGTLELHLTCASPGELVAGSENQGMVLPRGCCSHKMAVPACCVVATLGWTGSGIPAFIW